MKYLLNLESWLLGQAANGLFDAIKRDTFKDAVQTWIDEMDQLGLQVAPQAIQPQIFADQDQPKATLLNDRLRKGQLISREDLEDALLERWSQIRDLSHHPTNFFKIPKNDAQRHIRTLATRLQVAIQLNYDNIRARQEIEDSERLMKMDQKMTMILDKLSSTDIFSILASASKDSIQAKTNSPIDPELPISKSLDAAENKGALQGHALQMLIDIQLGFGKAGFKAQELLSEFRLVDAVRALPSGPKNGSKTSILPAAARAKSRLYAQIFDYDSAIAAICELDRDTVPSDLWIDLAEYYLQLNKFAESIDAATYAINKFSYSREELSSLLLSLGRSYRFMTDYTSSRECFETGLAIVNSESQMGIINRSIEYELELVNLLRTESIYPEALAKLNELLEKIGLTHDSDRLHSDALSIKGFIYAGLGEPEKAKDALERALRYALKAVGEKHPLTAQRLNDVGAFSTSANEAYGYYQKALKIDTRLFGDESPAVALRISNIATVEYALGDHKGGIESTMQSLKILRKFYPDSHPEIGKTVKQLGDMELHTGLVTQAEESYTTALEIAMETYTHEHPAIGSALFDLAVCVQESSPNNAKNLLRRAVKIFQTSLGPHHSDTQLSVNTLNILERRANNST